MDPSSACLLDVAQLASLGAFWFSPWAPWIPLGSLGDMFSDFWPVGFLDFPRGAPKGPLVVRWDGVSGFPEIDFVNFVFLVLALLAASLLDASFR